MKNYLNPTESQISLRRCAMMDTEVTGSATRPALRCTRLRISRISAAEPAGGLNEPEPGALASREDTNEVDARHACGRHLRRRVQRPGGATLDNARSGQVQVLGYTGAKRAAIAPEVSTIAEDGVPGFNVISWYGLFVPAKTPREIIMKMNADTIAALANPNVQGRLLPLGYESSPDSPERIGALLKSETELWTRVIKEAGIAPLD